MPKKHLNFGPDQIGKKLAVQKPRLDWKRLDAEQESYLVEKLEKIAVDCLNSDSTYMQTRGMQIVQFLRLIGWKFIWLRTRLAAEEIERGLT